MSNFWFTAIPKGGGQNVKGTAMDDYFGRHQYGYQLEGRKEVMTQDEFDERYLILD